MLCCWCCCCCVIKCEYVYVWCIWFVNIWSLVLISTDSHVARACRLESTERKWEKKKELWTLPNNLRDNIVVTEKWCSIWSYKQRKEMFFRSIGQIFSSKIRILSHSTAHLLLTKTTHALSSKAFSLRWVFIEFQSNDDISLCSFKNSVLNQYDVSIVHYDEIETNVNTWKSHWKVTKFWRYNAKSAFHESRKSMWKLFTFVAFCLVHAKRSSL